MPSGAVLRWIYDETEELTYSLLVRLTEDEAQRVFESDRRTGMLESVRTDLHWRGSLLTVSHEYDAPFPMWRYKIQVDSTEEEFIRDLMSPPFEVVRNAVLTAEQRRDYEFAAPMLQLAAA